MDLIFNQTKYSIILGSLDKITEKLELLYEHYTSGHIGQPILISYCHPQQTNIYYLPNPENIRKIIFEEFITENVYTAIFLKSFIDPQEFPNYMSCYEEVFDQNCDQNSNLNIRIKGDKKIMKYFTRIKTVVDNSFIELEKYTKGLIPIKQNHQKYSLINLDELNENVKSEELKDLYEKFKFEDDRIKKIKSRVHIGIFEYNTENLIDLIKDSPQVWVQTMKETIPRILILKINEFIQILRNNNKVSS